MTDTTTANVGNHEPRDIRSHSEGRQHGAPLPSSAMRTLASSTTHKIVSAGLRTTSQKSIPTDPTSRSSSMSFGTMPTMKASTVTPPST